MDENQEMQNNITSKEDEKAYLTPAPKPKNEMDRAVAVMTHTGSILISFVAPLTFWLIQKGRYPFSEQHAKEALNFQISVVLGLVLSSFIPLIEAVSFMIIVVLNVYFCIKAANAASNDEMYEYPLNLRLVK